METDGRDRNEYENSSPGSPQAQKLFETIDQPSWLTDVSRQAQTFNFLREFYGQLHPQERTDTVGLLAARLGISTDRVLDILTLREFTEIARALRASKNQQAIRLKEDAIYPASGWIGSYLAYAGGNESPLAWHFWTAVAVLGCACKRNYFHDGGNYFIYPNHYVMLLGPSGSKKGTSLSPGHELLGRVNQQLLAAQVHPADLITVAPKKVAPETFLHLLQARQVRDQTTGGSRYADSVAFFAISELAVLLGKTVFHSDHFIHILTDLYDCPPDYPIFTFKRGDEILRNVAISLVACTTQSWLEDAVSSEIFTGGFMGRCIIVPRGYTTKEYPVADFLDPIMRNKLASQLAVLPQASGTHMDFQSSSWYDDWYHGNKKLLADQTDPRLQGYYSRRHTHLIRLAMVLSLSENNTHITTKSLELANKILLHEEHYLTRTIANLGKHRRAREADLVLAIIRAAGTISRTHLSRKAFNITGGSRGLDRILESLLDQDLIELKIAGRARHYHTKEDK